MSFPRSRLPVWLHTLLVAALLWAPLWGHLHNIGHGIEHGLEHGTRHAISAPEGLNESLAGPAHDEHRHEGHSDALGHEADADLCRVLDHLSLAERLIASNAPGLAPMVAMAPPIIRADSYSDQHLWSPAQARAPPALI
jgi:hypothetical protein